MGPIAPAGWDRFFDFTGTPYDGPAYPQVDDSPPPFAKFGAAEAKFAMKYFPEEPYAEATTGPDDALPGAVEPYFLRAGRGTAPRPVRPGRLPADDRRRVGRPAGDDRHRGPAGPGDPGPRPRALLRGDLLPRRPAAGDVEGVEHLLDPAATSSASRPGTEHTYAMEAHLTRFASMFGPAGARAACFEVAGEVAAAADLPRAGARRSIRDRLAAAGAELDITFAG